MRLELIDGEAWSIIRGKKAGVTPARPERREFVSRDPEYIRKFLAMCDQMATDAEAPAAVMRKSAVQPKSQPKPPGSNAPAAQSPTRRHADTLPGWPRVLSVTGAAAYLSLSPSTFRATIGQEVAPIRLTPGRIGWDRHALDAWVDRRSGNVWDDSNPWDEVLGDVSTPRSQPGGRRKKHD